MSAAGTCLELVGQGVEAIKETILADFKSSIYHRAVRSSEMMEQQSLQKKAGCSAWNFIFSDISLSWLQDFWRELLTN